MQTLSLWATKADVEAVREAQKADFAALREDLQAVLTLADRAAPPATVVAEAVPGAEAEAATAADNEALPHWGWGWQFWTPIVVIVISGAVSTAYLRGGWAAAFIVASWPWLLGGAAGAAGAAAVLFGTWWVWWQLPKRQARRLDLADAKARADVEDNFRKTIGQLLGGAAVLIGAGAAYLQFTQQQRAGHDLLISNQVGKGFELLGNKDDKIEQRLGGIYALEGVMNDSEQYHQPVLEALCAFVRDGAQPKADNAPPKADISAPATDIQAALTVIGRRRAGAGNVDLANAHIPKANLSGADLGDAHLTFANLSSALLLGANLTDADLYGANLTGAHLTNANLSGAYLTGANLTGASPADANLSGANLPNANLSGAYLWGADLSGANLYGANLTGANLTFANLSGARNLTQGQLDDACGEGVNGLDPSLTFHDKPCPPKQQ